MKKMRYVSYGMLIVSLLAAMPSKGSQEWYKTYKPDTWNATLPLKEYEQGASKERVFQLLSLLHIFADSQDQESLQNIAQIAIKKAQPCELLDVSLICGKAHLEKLAKDVGIQAIDQEDNPFVLADMAYEFHLEQLDDLRIKSAQKAIICLLDSEMSSRGICIGMTLAKIGCFDLAEECFLHFLNNSSDWQLCFRIYQLLQECGKHKNAQKALHKTLKLIEQEIPRFGTCWFLYIAKKCLEDGYVDNSRLAARYAVKKEMSVRWLAKHLPHLADFGFDDLVQLAAKNLVKRYKKSHKEYYNSFLSLCKLLFDVKQDRNAEHLFYIKLSDYTDLHSFAELVEIIALFNKNGKSAIVYKGLKHLQALCSKPRDVMVAFIDGSLGFYRPSLCLLAAVQMSQDCDQSELAQQSADQAITCALAQPYETSVDLLTMLEDLAGNFRRMKLPYFAQKAEYYRADAESPLIRVMSLGSRSPRVFSIYWTQLTGARGSEIHKTRPCVVLTSANSYGCRKCVTIVPLSTKTRDELTSILVSINDKDHEARIDQIRTVDVSRLLDKFGELPDQYKCQLSLAVKNFIGK